MPGEACRAVLFEECGRIPGGALAGELGHSRHNGVFCTLASCRPDLRDLRLPNVVLLAHPPILAGRHGQVQTTPRP